MMMRRWGGPSSGGSFAARIFSPTTSPCSSSSSSLSFPLRNLQTSPPSPSRLTASITSSPISPSSSHSQRHAFSSSSSLSFPASSYSSLSSSSSPLPGTSSLIVSSLSIPHHLNLRTARGGRGRGGSSSSSSPPKSFKNPLKAKKSPSTPSASSKSPVTNKRPPKSKQDYSVEKLGRQRTATRDRKRDAAESAASYSASRPTATSSTKSAAAGASASSSASSSSPILKAAGIKSKSGKGKGWKDNYGGGDDKPKGRKMSLKDQERAQLEVKLQQSSKKKKVLNPRKVDLSTELGQPVEVVGDTRPFISSSRLPSPQKWDPTEISKESRRVDKTAPGFALLPPPMRLDDIVGLLREEKGINIFVMDLREKCNFTSYMIILEGRSARHMRSLAERILSEVKSRQREYDPVGHLDVEDKPNADWMVVDCGDILIHIMSPGARRYYDIEGLWILRPTLQAMMETGEGLAQDAEDLEDPPDLDDVPGGWHPLDMKL